LALEGDGEFHPIERDLRRCTKLRKAARGSRLASVRGVGTLRLPLYRRVVLIAALVLGSHAMHDSFAVIMWRAAGIGPGTALWSLSVAAEVTVFLFAGRPLLDRLDPAGAAMLAAAAGIVRWTVMAAIPRICEMICASLRCEIIQGVKFVLVVREPILRLSAKDELYPLEGASDTCMPPVEWATAARIRFGSRITL
jgi:hypothetical protein